MRTLTLGALLATGLAIAACNSGHGMSTSMMPTSPSSAMSAFAGMWTSTPATSVGACSAVTYTVTPTGANTAHISYTATCSGVAVTGTGSGTLAADATMNWTTTGSAGVCPFSLNGTAVPQGSSDMKVTYSGAICGVPVSGSDLLHR